MFCLLITAACHPARLVTVKPAQRALLLPSHVSSPTMITSSSFSHFCRSAAVFMGRTVSTLPGRRTEPVAATWGQCFLKAARMLGIPAQHTQQHMVCGCVLLTAATGYFYVMVLSRSRLHVCKNRKTVGTQLHACTYERNPQHSCLAQPHWHTSTAGRPHICPARAGGLAQPGAHYIRVLSEQRGNSQVASC